MKVSMSKDSWANVPGFELPFTEISVCAGRQGESDILAGVDGELHHFTASNSKSLRLCTD
jgi:hypothetical protein